MCETCSAYQQGYDRGFVRGKESAMSESVKTRDVYEVEVTMTFEATVKTIVKLSDTIGDAAKMGESLADSAVAKALVTAKDSTDSSVIDYDMGKGTVVGVRILREP